MKHIVAAASAAFIALVGLVASASTAGASAEMVFVAHSTNAEFITSSGPSLQPSGPLAPGDRIVFRDDMVEDSAVIGFDNGYCTVEFNDNTLCHLVARFTNRGDVSVEFLETGGAVGAGATVFDGIVTGGTFEFRGAQGSFHATQLPNGDTRVDLTLR